MNNNLISQLQEIINNNLSIDIGINRINTLEEFAEKKDSAIRLLKTLKLSRQDKKYNNDFDIALRDFLIITKSVIKINQFVLSDFGKSIGLNVNEEGIWVDQAYPDYIISNFALKAATAEDIPIRQDKNCYLYTNDFIRNLTGFKSFKSEEQKLCVMGSLRAPEGSSVLVSMSTGSGKSLITQTIAFQSDGLTIVIVPTISLMIDQEVNAKNILSQHKDEIAIYNSNSNFVKVKQGLISKQIKLLFLSPEALIKNIELAQIINDLNKKGWLKNFVIDEAHIIFEWGDSFRLDFQCVDVFRKNLYDTNNKLRTFLLSATFNQDNVRLLKKFYSIDKNWIELRCDSLRREIRYNFIKANSYYDKENKMLELIKTLPHPMIVYVDRPSEAIRINELLKSKGINNTNVFTGATSSKNREELINKWTNNEFQIMIATCAFGVGVDKKDVRTVLHLYMPDNINKYYQEAGRGGRDGKSCLSIILYNNEDESKSFSFIKSKVLTTDKIVGRWFSMLNGYTSIKYGDDTVRIDTSIKPTYSEQDECITFANSRDIDWNVYVLLFMKRYDLIEIESINFVDNKYFVVVRILDKNLFKNDSNIEEIISKYRDKEWSKIEKSYKDMVKFLSECNRQCVSEMLIQEYPLIPYEYCSGCNCHTDNIVKGTYSGLPLVSNAAIRLSDENKLNNANPLLIIRSNKFEVIEKKFLKDGIKTLVVDTSKDFEYIGQQEADLIVFTIDEFKKIINGNEYFISDEIIIECPDEESKIIKLLQLIDRLNNKYRLHIILVTKENYFLSTFNKKLYEVMESSFIEDYLFI